MKEGKLVKPKQYPEPGISYMLPDNTWLTIPPSATIEVVRYVQAQFWLAWDVHHQSQRRKFRNSKTSTKT